MPFASVTPNTDTRTALTTVPTMSLLMTPPTVISSRSAALGYTSSPPVSHRTEYRDASVGVTTTVCSTSAGRFVALLQYTVTTSPSLRPGTTGSGSLATAANTPGQQLVAPGAEPSGGTHPPHASTSLPPA